MNGEGIYAVPPEYAARKSFVEYYIQDLLNGIKRSTVESIQAEEPFRLFIDFDFRSAPIEEGLPEDLVIYVHNWIKKVFLCDSRSICVISARFDGGGACAGMHMHWPEILCSSELFFAARLRLLVALEKGYLFTEEKLKNLNQWSKVVDSSIYYPGKGLRMLGASKFAECSFCGGVARKAECSNRDRFHKEEMPGVYRVHRVLDVDEELEVSRQAGTICYQTVTWCMLYPPEDFKEDRVALKAGFARNAEEITKNLPEIQAADWDMLVHRMGERLNEQGKAERRKVDALYDAVVRGKRKSPKIVAQSAVSVEDSQRIADFVGKAINAKIRKMKQSRHLGAVDGTARTKAFLDGFHFTRVVLVPGYDHVFIDTSASYCENLGKAHKSVKQWLVLTPNAVTVKCRCVHAPPQAGQVPCKDWKLRVQLKGAAAIAVSKWLVDQGAAKGSANAAPLVERPVDLSIYESHANDMDLEKLAMLKVEGASRPRKKFVNAEGEVVVID